MKTETRRAGGQRWGVAGVSRAGSSRHREPETPRPEDLKLRDALHPVAWEGPCYGSRRRAQELRDRGWKGNRKRVQRLMREDHLRCVARRKLVFTPNSAPELAVQPNLAREIARRGVNQLWVADIPDLRWEEEFVYRAVILDAYSHRGIGWHLDDTLRDSLSIAALQMALAQRPVPAGLGQHSDRGVQYASLDYTQVLQHHGITLSMSRKGHPWDNAACASFMKTLKYEEVHRTEYRHLADARARIGEFRERVYHEKRLPSALPSLAPDECERRSACCQEAA